MGRNPILSFSLAISKMGDSSRLNVRGGVPSVHIAESDEGLIRFDCPSLLWSESDFAPHPS
jgi:hypothetical protein